VQHHRRLREIKLLRDATILYVFENNYAMEHDHLTELVTNTRAFGNSAVLYEDPGKIGFKTDHPSKLRADDWLQHFVSYNKMRIAHDVLSVNEKQAKGAQGAVELLLTQIGNMREYVKRKPNNREMRYVGGMFDEFGKEIEGRHDDVQRALSIGLSAMINFFNRRLPVRYDIIEQLQARRPIHLPAAAKRSNPYADSDGLGVDLGGIVPPPAKRPHFD